MSDKQMSIYKNLKPCLIRIKNIELNPKTSNNSLNQNAIAVLL